MMYMDIVGVYMVIYIYIGVKLWFIIFWKNGDFII